MAKIIDNNLGRRTILLNTNDIVNIVREYQNVCVGKFSYQEVRNILDELEFYLPEDMS